MMYMERDYQRMHVDERIRHHDELREDGFGWCPECGETLVWDLPKPCEERLRAGEAPVVTGDCPPLTAAELATTAPPVS